jgi:hypothetical protein
MNFMKQIKVLSILLCLLLLAINTGCEEMAATGRELASETGFDTPNDEGDDSVTDENPEPEAPTEPVEDPEPNPEPVEPDPIVEKPLMWPEFDWDNKHPNFKDWNQYTFDSIEEVGEHLINKRPDDILTFCPNYDNLNDDGKKIFWISLLAAMTRFESSFNPEARFTEAFTDANGNRVISRGLLQLSIESSLGYRCPLNSAQDLHDPELNLDCAVRIMDRWIDRDGAITFQTSSGAWRGGARYWSVLRKASTLGSIREKTRSNEVCQ